MASGIELPGWITRSSNHTGIPSPSSLRQFPHRRFVLDAVAAENVEAERLRHNTFVDYPVLGATKILTYQSYSGGLKSKCRGRTAWHEGVEKRRAVLAVLLCKRATQSRHRPEVVLHAMQVAVRCALRARLSNRNFANYIDTASVINLITRDGDSRRRVCVPRSNPLAAGAGDVAHRGRTVLSR